MPVVESGLLYLSYWFGGSSSLDWLQGLFTRLLNLPNLPMTTPNHNSNAKLIQQLRAVKPVRPVKPSIPAIHCPECGEHIAGKLAKLYIPELIKLGRILVRKVNKANKTAAAAAAANGDGGG